MHKKNIIQKRKETGDEFQISSILMYLCVWRDASFVSFYFINVNCKNKKTLIWRTETFKPKTEVILLNRYPKQEKHVEFVDREPSWPTFLLWELTLNWILSQKRTRRRKNVVSPKTANPCMWRGYVQCGCALSYPNLQ